MNLNNLLTRDLVSINLHAQDWRDAIRQVGELMVQAGKVEHSYIDGMIHTAEQLGPYIVIAPHIAMPHARPEDGVIKPCFALATFSPSINFGNPQNDPVQLVFAFAAIDKNQHIQALTEIASIFTKMFTQDGGIETVLSAKNRDELMSIMFSYLG
jgi:mannitol/fructose-specific phosphotransferase system IIA component (Ntr-type)